MAMVTLCFKDGFAAEGEESGTKFNDVDLSDDWCDFDERQNEPVCDALALLLKGKEAEWPLIS